MSESELRRFRGNEIAMIFQDPMTSMNPVYRVGDQIVEAIVTHEDVSKQTARNRAVELLRQVGIPHPEERVDDYPHQFSGGMRQRAMIAMALANNPDDPHRRRADDGARRDDPGADHRADRPAQGRLQLVRDPHHARPRRRRGHRRRHRRDVRGPHRRVRDEAAGVLRPAASVHLGPARLDPAARPREARAAARRSPARRRR